MDQLMQFVQNHWELSLGFAAVVILIIIEEVKRNAGGIKRLSPQDLTLMMNHDEITLIDLRPTNEFRAGYILGSINIAETNADELAKKLEQYKNKQIALVHTTENVSFDIANKLVKKEFKVSILAGGLGAWKNASLPLAKK
jgi:rhodanese-related sulfurtransferase